MHAYKVVSLFIGTLRVWPCLQSRFVVSNTIVPTLIGTLRVWTHCESMKRASKNSAPYVVACVMSLHCPCVCTVCIDHLCALKHLSCGHICRLELQAAHCILLRCRGLVVKSCARLLGICRMASLATSGDANSVHIAMHIPPSLATTAGATHGTDF